MLVAGDISLDGDKILLRRAKNNGAWMWQGRAQGQTVEDLLLNSASCDLDLEPEEKPESIAVSPDGKGFYGTSEGGDQPVYYWEFQ